MPSFLVEMEIPKILSTKWPFMCAAVLWLVLLPVVAWAEGSMPVSDAPKWIHLGLAVLANAFVVIWRVAVLQTEFRNLQLNYAEFKERAASSSDVAMLEKIMDEKTARLSEKIDDLKK